MPASASALCSPAASVVLPTPSTPSIVISRPRSRIGADCNGCRSRIKIVVMLEALERHPNALAVLGPALKPEGRPSHAYLFHGPGGAGKRTLAREVAATLLAYGA